MADPQGAGMSEEEIQLAQQHQALLELQSDHMEHQQQEQMMLEKARAQQQIMEAEQQREMLAHQQQAMLAQQEDAELLQQQQIAIMEAQRERHMQQGGPPQPSRLGQPPAQPAGPPSLMATPIPAPGAPMGPGGPPGQGGPPQQGPPTSQPGAPPPLMSQPIQPPQMGGPTPGMPPGPMGGPPPVSVQQPTGPLPPPPFGGRPGGPPGQPPLGQGPPQPPMGGPPNQGPQPLMGPPQGPPQMQGQGPPPLMSQGKPGPMGPPHMGGPPGQMPMQTPGPPQMPPGMGQGPPPMSMPGPNNEGPPQGPGAPPMGQPGPPRGQMPGPGPQMPPGQGPPPMGPRGQGPGQMGQGPPQMPEPPLMGHGPPQGQGPPPLMGQGQEQMRLEGRPEMRPEGRPSPPPAPVPLMAKEIQPAEMIEAGEMKLPQALEKVLAFKEVRAQQVGVKLEETEMAEKEEEMDVPEPEMIIEDFPDVSYGDEEDYEDEPEPVPESQLSQKQKQQRQSKNKKKKEKKKKAKARKQEEQTKEEVDVGKTKMSAGLALKRVLEQKKQEEEEAQIEYVQEQPDIDVTDPFYAQFARIFNTFKISEPEKKSEVKEAVEAKPEPKKAPMNEDMDSDDDDDDDNEMKDDDDKPKMSKKKLKKLNRLSVAELKQLVTRPDVVEMHDVTAQDPKLLVHLKATRNSVPVPRHWCFKRKYLQGKRGIEKPPFELPDYIKATGIMEMREALHEKEEQKTMKSKMREKVRPKMGKIDIDYQKLHDAFFKWQVKPKMTIHGNLYYEGKEFETRLKEKKPGNLSDELRTALGMPIGPNAEKFPPPWLIAMQRYGPPPSYPSLKIQGLNAPIPEGCAFGYHAGGWGKPPVDQSGKPLYGDVFGTQSSDFQTPVQEEDIDRSRWGELESESESEEESSEDESDEEDVDKTGLITPGDAGLVTPSGLTSIPVGMETPDIIELRKKRIEDAMDQGGDTPALYQVLPEKKQTVGGAMMGSAHTYDITAAVAGKKPGDKVDAGGVEVALNPEELDLDTAAMQAKYEQTVREQQSQLEKEDLGDMVAEHVAKQKKRKKQQQDTGKASKKYKEFKF